MGGEREGEEGKERERKGNPQRLVDTRMSKILTNSLWIHTFNLPWLITRTVYLMNINTQTGSTIQPNTITNRIFGTALKCEVVDSSIHFTITEKVNSKAPSACTRTHQWHNVIRNVCTIIYCQSRQTVTVIIMTMRTTQLDTCNICWWTEIRGQSGWEGKN